MIIIKPNPGMQERFLASSADECLFGGQAGGGKSWSLLFRRLRYISHPKYRALLLRRTMPQLGHLLEEAMEMYLPLRAKFTGMDREYRRPSFTFPSGARVIFSHLQEEKDKYHWQGFEFDEIDFDEVTHFTRTQYLYLASRNRSKTDIPKTMRATANPDGQGLLWVKARFVDKVRPVVEKKYFRSIGDQDLEAPPAIQAQIQALIAETGRAAVTAHPVLRLYQSRQFIPCIRSENGFLAADYEGKLWQLPEAERRALLDGIWEIQDHPRQLIKGEWLTWAERGDNPYEDGPFAAGFDYSEIIGGDLCVGTWGKGNRPEVMREWPGMMGPAYAQVIAEVAQPFGRQISIGVDSIGPGASTWHSLQAHHEKLAERCNPCRHKDPGFDRRMKLQYDVQFDCWRTQAWWNFMLLMQAGAIDLSVLARTYPNYHMLKEEILAHTYKVENGVVKVVSKNDLRKSTLPDGKGGYLPSLGRSPDRADALVIRTWVWQHPVDDGKPYEEPTKRDYDLEPEDAHLRSEQWESQALV